MIKTKEEIINRLEQLQAEKPSTWHKDAMKERENRSWLRHSKFIAVMVLGKLRDLHITQKDLAERMGCSQQYISKIVSGKENLSLETLSKLERALNVSFFNTQYQYFLEEEPEPMIVAEDCVN